MAGMSGYKYLYTPITICFPWDEGCRCPYLLVRRCFLLDLQLHLRPPSPDIQQSLLDSGGALPLSLQVQGQGAGFQHFRLQLSVRVRCFRLLYDSGFVMIETETRNTVEMIELDIFNNYPCLKCRIQEITLAQGGSKVGLARSCEEWCH